jgi:phosphotriesterase-related protein
MATIETALGPIEASRLGFTLSHEHVFANAGEDLAHYPWMFDRDRMRENAIASLRQAKAEGVDALIDLTTPDLNRDVRFIEEVSRASGVHVVVATGIWRDPPRSFATRDIDASAGIFVREIETGIDGTSIKAGAIKVANDEEGISPAHERVLRAAARASRRTGCPISTHHWARGEQGREQLRIFLEEGADPNRICIGHSADTTNVDYLDSLLQQGVWLSMDRYPGRPPRPGWQERNTAVKALIDRGWAHRLMLGHDASATRPVPAGMTEVPSDGYNPDGLLFLTRVGLPALLADGVPQSTIDVMMRDVPRRFLTGEE